VCDTKELKTGKDLSNVPPLPMLTKLYFSLKRHWLVLFMPFLSSPSCLPHRPPFLGRVAMQSHFVNKAWEKEINSTVQLLAVLAM